MTRARPFVNNPIPVTTSGVTVATITTFDPLNGGLGIDNCGMQAHGHLIGKDTGNDNIVCFEIQATFRMLNGTLSLRGSSSIISATGDTALILITPSFDANSGLIRLRSGGITLNTMEWTGWIEIHTGEYP